MEKRRLGKKGLEVTAISLGITFLDTADMYGL
jgi:aryl-alcohol dehydrogenase-like predicted oxidoreductase